MKKITWFILCSFVLMSVGCSYDAAYSSYSLTQSMIAQSAGPIVEFHENGQLKAVGNPMVALMGMQMKPPKDAWEYLFDFLKFATPFAAIYGVVGAMSTNLNPGNSTNVTGEGNFVGNTASGPASWASPVTTTTTTTMGAASPIE